MLPDLTPAGAPITVLGAEAALCDGPANTYWVRRRDDVTRSLPVVAGTRESPVMLRFALVPASTGFVVRGATGLRPRNKDDAHPLRAFFDRLHTDLVPVLARDLALHRVCPIGPHYATASDAEEEQPGVGYFHVSDSMSPTYFGSKAGVATFAVYVEQGRIKVKLTDFLHTHNVYTPLQDGAPWTLTPVGGADE